MEKTKEDFRRGLRLQPNAHCYKILGQIDNTQFGHVSHIKWFDRILVCKSFRKDCVEKKERTTGHPTKENMYREIEILNWARKDRNASKYIIRLFGVVDDGAYYRIIMERGEYELYKYNANIHIRLRYHLNTADDGESQALISDHHKEVSRLYREIIDGVAYLHKNNICHCDLSLENIVVVNNSIRIIDFGLAKWYKGELPEGTGRIGKTFYVSTECFRNERWDPKDNDMWALGVILWYMLLGTQPWEMPDQRDKHFKCIYVGAEGISMMLEWFANGKPNSLNRIFGLKSSQIDFLSKIFCSRNERMKMYEVKQHPLYTWGHDKLGVEQFPKQLLAVIPARKIEQNIGSLCSSFHQSLGVSDRDCRTLPLHEPQNTDKSQFQNRQLSGRVDSIEVEDKLSLDRREVHDEVACRGQSVSEGINDKHSNESTANTNTHSETKIINDHYSYEKSEKKYKRRLSIDFSQRNPTVSQCSSYNHDNRHETKISREGMCSSESQNSSFVKRNHNRPIPDVLNEISNRQLSRLV